MLSIYPACFYKEENGYSVIFPDLNWLSTCGDNLENAMEMAVDCLAGYIYTCQADGESIPQPSNPSNIDAAAIAKELDLDASDHDIFISMVSVDVNAYAKEHFEKSIKKNSFYSRLVKQSCSGCRNKFFPGSARSIKGTPASESADALRRQLSAASSFLRRRN